MFSKCGLISFIIDLPISKLEKFNSGIKLENKYTEVYIYMYDYVHTNTVSL